MVERHLMETCNRVCTNSVQRYKPAKQISTQTLFAFAFAGILGLYWLNLYCTKQSTNQETSGELSWAPLRLRLDYALCKEHVFKGARKKKHSYWQAASKETSNDVHISKQNFQGTYLDTILPRADIPQNQVQFLT